MHAEATAAKPVRPVPVAELQAVRRRVFHALHEWERAGAIGSARPVFERAYRVARSLEQADRALDEQHREWLWREWLEAGQPLTAETKVAILERLTPAARAWLGGVPTRDPSPPPMPERVPGEDDCDDDPTPAWA